MQPFRGTLSGVKGVALTALIVVPVTAAAVVEADHDTPHGSVTAQLARNIAVPAAQIPDRCHGNGALIRANGRIRQVGLVRGLRTYTHKAPGTFIKLCTGPTASDPGSDAGATPQGS